MWFIASGLTFHLNCWMRIEPHYNASIASNIPPINSAFNCCSKSESLLTVFYGLSFRFAHFYATKMDVYIIRYYPYKYSLGKFIRWKRIWERIFTNECVQCDAPKSRCNIYAKFLHFAITYIIIILKPPSTLSSSSSSSTSSSSSSFNHCEIGMQANRINVVEFMLPMC